MDPSSANQEIGSQTLESMLMCTRVPQQEKKPRPADEQALKCPRCDSTNTKFCYYNNYSLSQPRYFCKSCRRYWTKGGTLRNVPVGGGCRKNKRSSSSSTSSSSSSIKRSQDQSIIPTTINNQSPLIPISSSYDHHSSSNDLNLAIARLHKQTSLGLGDEHDHRFTMWGNNPNMSQSHHGSTDVNILGMNNHINTSLGLFDALGTSTFLDHQHAPSSGGHANNFYGSLMGINGQDHHMMENTGGINGIIQDMGIEHEFSSGTTTTSTAVTTLKQEIINARSNIQGTAGGTDQTRVLWGFPWQINGDGDQLDPNGRSLAWNGIGSSNNWHGLLNSPLM